MVWDSVATEWAETDDWMSAREKKCTPADKNAPVTFALDRMSLCTVHWRGKGKWSGSENTKPFKPSRTLQAPYTGIFMELLETAVEHQRTLNILLQPYGASREKLGET